MFKVDELTHDLIEEQNVNQDTSEQLEHEIKERLRWQNEFNLEKQRADEVEKVIFCFIYIWRVVKRPHFDFSSEKWLLSVLTAILWKVL